MSGEQFGKAYRSLRKCQLRQVIFGECVGAVVKIKDVVDQVWQQTSKTLEGNSLQS